MTDAERGPRCWSPDPQVASLLDEILREVKRAVHKFPTWPTDPIHAASILAEEVGELQQGCNELTYEPGKTTRLEVRAEAIESAAMALRFLVSFDIYDFAPSAQHQQEEVFHGLPKPSEPTPDEDTAKLTMPAMITEAECNRRIEEAEHEVELDMQAFEDIWVRQVALAKREQMEADCRAVETFPVLAASLRDELVAAIRAVWEKEHRSEGGEE